MSFMIDRKSYVVTDVLHGSNRVQQCAYKS